MKLPTQQSTSFAFSDLFDLDSVSKLKLSMRSMNFNRKAGFSPYVPILNSNYTFEYSTGLRKLFFYLATGKGLCPWLFGPQGCGKTSVIAQLAAWFNTPLKQMYVSPTSEAEDLLFGYMPGSDGVLRIRHCTLAEAMEKGYWFIINEFDLLDPAQQKALNQLVEERVIELPTGERITAHKNFRLIVTANTNGTGDFSGNACNVGQSDSSVSARFFFIPCDYLSPEKEENILKPAALETLSMYGLSEESCGAQTWGEMLSTINNIMIPTIISFANEIRASYKGALAGGKGFPFTIGHRTTLEWVTETVVDFLWETDGQNGIHNAVETGLNHSFIQGVRPDYQDEVKNLFNELVGNSLKRSA